MFVDTASRINWQNGLFSRNENPLDSRDLFDVPQFPGLVLQSAKSSPHLLCELVTMFLFGAPTRRSYSAQLPTGLRNQLHKLHTQVFSTIQIIREFLRVNTNPADARGSGDKHPITAHTATRRLGVDHSNWLALVFAALLATCIAPVQAHTPTPALQGVADNTWLQVSTNGQITADVNTMSYSGGWYDPVYHQLCVFGGGHWDYSGNEVWCLDIATLTWKELYPPDAILEPNDYYDGWDADFPGALFNPPGESLATARPMSKHTYDQMEFVDGLGPLVWGGYNWGDGSLYCGSCEDTWAFDYLGVRWNYLYNGNNEAPNADAGVGHSAYAHQEGKLYAVVYGNTWIYDAGSNEWREVDTDGNPPASIEGTLEYDPTRNVLYALGGRDLGTLDLWRFDIATRVWTELNASGNGPDGVDTRGLGLAYDNVNDVLLVLRDGKLWAYHPVGGNWEAINANGDVPTADINQVFGRFRYDPVNQGFWFHGATWTGDREHTTWFYRYASGQPAPEPTVHMVASPPAALGLPVTLAWSASRAATCTAAGDWGSDKAISGTESIGVLDVGTTTTYTLQCTGPGGSGSRTLTISEWSGGAGAGGGSNSSGDEPSSGTSAGIAFLLVLTGALWMRRRATSATPVVTQGN